jgi:hypothetical protein
VLNKEPLSKPGVSPEMTIDKILVGSKTLVHEEQLKTKRIFYISISGYIIPSGLGKCTELCKQRSYYK